MRQVLHTLLVFTVSAGYVCAHPMHFSFTEIEWNEDTQCLEVSVQFVPEDLELALQRSEGKPKLRLESDEAGAAIQRYLGSRFSFNDEKISDRMRWIGSETTVEFCFAYFEWPVDSRPNKIRVSNKALFEVSDEQVNVVNFRDAGRLLGTQLTARKSSSVISLTPTSELSVD